MLVGQRDQFGRTRQRKCFQAPRNSCAIHARHVPVQQHHVIRLTRGIGPRDLLQGSLSCVGRGSNKAHPTQHFSQYLAGVFHIIHHQHPATTHIVLQLQATGVTAAQFQVHGKPECGALAGHTGHPDLTAHLLGQ